MHHSADDDKIDSPTDQHCFIPYILIYYYIMSHDDFMGIYADKHQSFSQGYQAGLKQAETYDFSESITNGELLGIAFGKQIALYSSFIEVYHENHQSLTISNKKVDELVKEMQEQIAAIKYDNIEELSESRQTLKKKFNILMAMLGIKGYFNNLLYKNPRDKSLPVVKIEQTCDF